MAESPVSEATLHRWQAVCSGSPDLHGFYLYAYDQAHAKATAQQMVDTYRNNGRGPYANLKLDRVIAAPQEADRA